MLKKTDHQKRIEKFMALAGQDVPSSPSMPSYDVRKLRARLIIEEAIEAVEALGFSIVCNGDRLHKSNIVLDDGIVGSLAQIAHECADVSVVTIGTLSACGIPDEPVLAEVDRANLSKVKGGIIKDENGKVQKPKNFKPADVKSVIDNLTKSE